MCTSLTYQAKEGAFYLARTMDYAVDLHAHPVVIPRGHQFTSAAGDDYTANYAFLGAGVQVAGNYIMIDGVNEVGLGAAALYFPDEAHYDADPAAGKCNLAAHDFLAWLLGTVKNVAALPAALKQMHLIDRELAALQVSLPFHWIIADKTGATKVLEAQQDGVHLLDDPVGVMTNSPEFGWHLKNLSNYQQLQPQPHADKTYGGLTVTSFGPGSGALGLPGDATSISRFVRIAYARQYAETVAPDQAVNTLCHLLNTVEIPKGLKLGPDGRSDYTQYRSYLRLDQPTLYMQPYDDQTISCVQLTEALASAKAPHEYPLTATQAIRQLA